MFVQEFFGCCMLIEVIDYVVSQFFIYVIIDILCNSLCCLICVQEVILLECVYEIVEGCYVCCEFYCSEEYGYCVVVMIWGFGQGMLIYDYCGMWCVEGVWSGVLEVVQYECFVDENGQWCFQLVGLIQVGLGLVGSLILLYEYYIICNFSDDVIVVSLYIYFGQMIYCVIFQFVVDVQCYECYDCQLGFDFLY